MSNRDFIRPIEYVNIGKYNHGETRDRGSRLYCTATPETYDADNARHALQIFTPLQCHDEDTPSSRQSGPSPGRVK
jgi:hypothetical protein